MSDILKSFDIPDDPDKRYEWWDEAIDAAVELWSDKVEKKYAGSMSFNDLERAELKDSLLKIMPDCGGPKHAWAIAQVIANIVRAAERSDMSNAVTEEIDKVQERLQERGINIHMEVVDMNNNDSILLEGDDNVTKLLKRLREGGAGGPGMN